MTSVKDVVSRLAARAVERVRRAGAAVDATVRPAGRRAPEIVVTLGLVLSVLGVLVLVGAGRNDAKIEADTGRAVAEVLDGSTSQRTFVRFTAEDGSVLTPEDGIFYPRGLEAGQLVRVEYDRAEPELVRVEGRDWSIALLPVLLGVLAVWAVCGPAAWFLARVRRRRRAAARAALWRTDTGPTDRTRTAATATGTAAAPSAPGADSAPGPDPAPGTGDDEREDGEPEMAGAGAR